MFVCLRQLFLFLSSVSVVVSGSVVSSLVILVFLDFVSLSFIQYLVTYCF